MSIANGKSTVVPSAGNQRPIDNAAITALTKWSSLQRVSLFAGRIEDNGAACIASQAAERCWPALQHLDLGACDLSLTGVQHMVTALLAGGLPALQVKLACAAPQCTMYIVYGCGRGPHDMYCLTGAIHRSQPCCRAARRAREGIGTSAREQGGSRCGLAWHVTGVNCGNMM